MKLMSALVTAAVVAGCSTSYDQRMATDFIPMSTGGWTYKTYADITTPLDDAKSEAYRMSMLEAWLAQNGLCQDGYAAENRRAVRRSGAVHDVFYDVRCI